MLIGAGWALSWRDTAARMVMSFSLSSSSILLIDDIGPTAISLRSLTSAWSRFWIAC
jgi:hypothetical protein